MGHDFVNTIVYAPISGNIMMKITMDEPFEYEENGVKMELQCTETAFIYSPAIYIYTKVDWNKERIEIEKMK